MELSLNNLQRLICHKTQQTKPINSMYIHEVMFDNNQHYFTYKFIDLQRHKASNDLKKCNH